MPYFRITRGCLLLVGVLCTCHAHSAGVNLGSFASGASVPISDSALDAPFTDAFNFTIVAGSALIVSSTLTSGPSNFSFIHDLAGGLYSGTTLIEAGVATDDTSLFFARTVSLAPIVLDSGTYSLVLTGTPSFAFPDINANAYFNGALTFVPASPVPEPSLPIALAAGLLAVTARCRLKWGKSLHSIPAVAPGRSKRVPGATPF
jgi:hypothetical protein